MHSSGSETSVTRQQPQHQQQRGQSPPQTSSSSSTSRVHPLPLVVALCTLVLILILGAQPACAAAPTVVDIQPRVFSWRGGERLTVSLDAAGALDGVTGLSIALTDTGVSAPPYVFPCHLLPFDAPTASSVSCVTAPYDPDQRISYATTITTAISIAIASSNWTVTAGISVQYSCMFRFVS